MKGPEAYARAALDGECKRLRSTSDNRNTALRNAAFAVGTVLHGGVGFDEALAELVASSQLERSEAEYTARKGLSDGQHKPRAIPEDYQPSRRRGKRRKRATQPVAPPKPPPALDVPAELEELLATIWEALEAAPVPERFMRWADSRGLCHGALDDAGWRDNWSLDGILRGFDEELLTAAGFMKDGKLWTQTVGRYPGALVPIWHTSALDDATLRYRYPVAYRLRYYAPPEGRPKAVAMYRGQSSAEWQQWPLTTRYGLMHRTGHVIICEGEPDTATLDECLWGRACVVGIPGGGNWREHWTPELLAPASKLTIATHREAAGSEDLPKLAEQVAHAWATLGKPTDALRMRRTPGENDWNDKHRAGCDVQSEVTQ